jgi:hypothetical protein
MPAVGQVTAQQARAYKRWHLTFFSDISLLTTIYNFILISQRAVLLPKTGIKITCGSWTRVRRQEEL